MRTLEIVGKAGPMGGEVIAIECGAVNMIRTGAAMIYHEFQDSGNGLCKAIAGNLICNSPKEHAVHNMANYVDPNEKTVKIENPSNQVRTMPVDIMPPNAQEVNPRKL